MSENGKTGGQFTNLDLSERLRTTARRLTYNEDKAQGDAKFLMFESADRLDRARLVNCDQIAWMLAAINRHLPAQEGPRVNRSREMQSYALLYELMEVANLKFEDDRAAHNATPPDVFLLRRKEVGPAASLAKENGND